MVRRAKTVNMAVLLFVVSCIGLPPVIATADQPYVTGEQQPLLGPTETWALYPAGFGQNLVQTFTPSSNQWLGYLELPVGCAEGALLNVKILDGLDGPILYEVNVSGLPTGVDGSFQLIQVFNPVESAHGIKLHKNREYAFQLAAFPSGAGNTCGLAKGPAANSYAGGRGYYEDPINGPGFRPLPNGVETDDEDLPFKTLVR